MAGGGGGKAAIPSPIDRPLARAYLREFTGWSTAYPPGMSDSTSLRTMENVYITREGAVRIRPAIRSVFTQDTWLGNDGVSFIVGSFEHFVYDETGRTALLFGVRSGGQVGFRVVVYNEVTDRFDFVQGTFPNVTFGDNTTYIKYLQIDNKILALSDDPDEPAIIFYVGATKTAKKVPEAGISIPAWTDAPIVVHPDAAWIDDTTKTTRPAAETPLPETLISTLPVRGNCSISIATPAVVNKNEHGLVSNQSIIFTTTGALPTGLAVGTTYYVKSVMTSDTFTVAASIGGAAIATSGTQSGTHTVTDGPDPDGTAADSANVYSFGYFYTFETEFGESAPSGTTVVKTQRGWSQWKFNSPDSTGRPETTIVTDPSMAMDQLVAMLPTGQWAAAKSAGAVRWNLYQYTWNDTSAVPSVATLVASGPIGGTPKPGDPPATEAGQSWLQNTAAAPADSYVIPVPNEDNRVNYSGGPTGRNGIAAGDRLTLVFDGENQARIKWASNIPGEYLNFSPSKGGGQKTLSSGNLNVPLNIALWQNPQAVDTLCITTKGLNGYHAAYYMAPASVSGQSDSTLIMGFEQTTATPGTISPYGVEVLNNKLYHPLEAELMASTAANYSISHKTMSTDIANKWQRLANTQNIISSQHDGRLYYIVDNPEGDLLEPGCKGNEVWVLDAASENPTWSRWRVQGISLHKLQIGNKLFMALVRPDAIFIFNELAFRDEYANGATTLYKAISWKIETNTLGANRQHDAWSYVHQANVHVGDWIGGFEWGIRGWDTNDRIVEKRKRSHAPQVPASTSVDGVIQEGQDLGDATDSLLIGREMMEWTFFAQSITDAAQEGESRDGSSREGELVAWNTYGQIDFVQFMVAPASMNIGYERGSIETFEYRRNAYRGAESGTAVTRNGLPMPLDTRRP